MKRLSDAEKLHRVQLQQLRVRACQAQPRLAQGLTTRCGRTFYYSFTRSRRKFCSWFCTQRDLVARRAFERDSLKP